MVLKVKQQGKGYACLKFWCIVLICSSKRAIQFASAPPVSKEARRHLTPASSASLQVPGRGGLHRHHPGHAVQARAVPPGPLIGAEWGHGT